MKLPRTYRDAAALVGRPGAIRRIMNLWPPFLFSSIHITEISDDWRRVGVRLRKRRLTVNYVGTQYGGSLYSMTDPFWMMMVLHNLTAGHTVWDAAGEIRFVRPGRADVTTEFVLTDADLAAITEAVERDGRTRHWFTNDIVDADGTLIAQVRKQVYVRAPGGPKPADQG